MMPSPKVISFWLMSPVAFAEGDFILADVAGGVHTVKAAIADSAHRVHLGDHGVPPLLAFVRARHALLEFIRRAICFASRGCSQCAVEKIVKTPNVPQGRGVL